MGEPSLDIVVPTLNEEATVGELVRRLRSTCPNARLIFVDNGSVDRTVPILESLNVDIIRRKENKGYGRSLRDGIAHGDAEYVATIDADLEYPPEDLPGLIARLRHDDVVYGSRFAGEARVGGWLRIRGNLIITRIFNALFRQSISDLYTGIKAFRRSALNGLSFERDGFVFVVEFAAKLARNGRAISERPVSYRPRTTGQRKMRHAIETLKALWFLVVYRLSPFRVHRS